MKFQNLAEKSLNWLKSDYNFLFVVAIFGVLSLTYSSYSTLLGRIVETGLHNFPNVWQDWFAVTAAAILLPLIIMGIYSIIKYFIANRMTT
jgi:uncharacterized membrane protein (DUF2068 family)